PEVSDFPGTGSHLIPNESAKPVVQCHSGCVPGRWPRLSSCGTARGPQCARFSRAGVEASRAVYCRWLGSIQGEQLIRVALKMLREAGSAGRSGADSLSFSLSARPED